MKRTLLVLLAGLAATLLVQAQPQSLDFYARRYLGQPYVEHVLEVSPERLVVDTARVDCMTLVEYCLARRMADAGRGAFRDCVQALRYRDKVERYADRLHYASEWILHAEEAGIVKDISLDIGGTQVSRTIRFMSAHPGSYDALSRADAESKEDLRIIRDEVEPRLSARPFCYVPKDRIREIERDIRDGDIIFFTTSVEGLDVSHMAIACIQPPRRPDPGKAALRPVVGFIHASQTAGKVMVDPMSIAEYALSRKSITGIKVVRPL